MRILVHYCILVLDYYIHVVQEGDQSISYQSTTFKGGDTLFVVGRSKHL